jgi:hypothetical protein
VYPVGLSLVGYFSDRLTRRVPSCSRRRVYNSIEHFEDVVCVTTVYAWKRRIRYGGLVMRFRCFFYYARYSLSLVLSLCLFFPCICGVYVYTPCSIICAVLLRPSCGRRTITHLNLQLFAFYRQKYAGRRAKNHFHHTIIYFICIQDELEVTAQQSVRALGFLQRCTRSGITIIIIIIPTRQPYPDERELKSCARRWSHGRDTRSQIDKTRPLGHRVN